MDSNCLVDDFDAPIYRVFPLRWFEDMILNKTMGLVRPSGWADPFENFVLKCKVQTPDGLASLQSLHDKWYGQCWTLKPDNDALWRIYSHDLDGVQVSTTVRKLFKAVCDPSDPFAQLMFFIGKVDYLERREIEDFLSKITFKQLVYGGQNQKLARTLLVKRKEFEHEQEVRLLFYNFHNVSAGKVFPFSFPYDTVLEEAVLDPRLAKAEFEHRKRVLETLGCSVSIRQSDLYRIDEIVIPPG